MPFTNREIERDLLCRAAEGEPEVEEPEPPKAVDGWGRFPRLEELVKEERTEVLDD